MSKHSKEQVEELLDLLTQYVDSCRVHEQIMLSVKDDRIAKNVVGCMMAAYQKNYMIPLMESCKKSGYTYKQLYDIIPPSFETTDSERQLLLIHLKIYAGTLIH